MNKELSLEQETIEDCPILYRMRYRPCDETCMCYGWEHARGWDAITSSMSRQLEMLNIQFYPKYRVRIQMDQIKEKYGEYRAYWSIVVDPNKLMTWLGHKFEAIYDWLNYYKRFDYKLKRITDVEPFDHDKITEITEVVFKEKTDPNYKGIKCSNVEYQEKDGKYFEVCHLHDYGKSHMEPTRLKTLWHIKNFCYKARNWFLYSTSKKDTAAVRNCIEYMYRRASEIVKIAEQKCSNTCELCGHQIGTEWSPTCMTTSWIKYICDECAKKQSGTYVKNGELWQGDKKLKSKKKSKKKN